MRRNARGQRSPEVAIERRHAAPGDRTRPARMVFPLDRGTLTPAALVQLQRLAGNDSVSAWLSGPPLPVQRCGQPGCACEAEEAGALPVQREDGQYGPCAHTSCPSPEQIGLPTRPPADAPPECGDPWKRKCYEGADNDTVGQDIDDPDNHCYSRCSYAATVCECYDRNLSGPPPWWDPFGLFQGEPKLIGMYKVYRPSHEED